jgi:CubicO group peptidase (beta-lactamase class C family)
MQRIPSRAAGRSTSAMSECPIDEVAEQLRAAVVDAQREHRLPGVMAAIVHGDRAAWAHGVGFADIANRRAPDTATLYRIASITKTFTATAIMQLRDEGLLDLDDPAVHHIPELAAADVTVGPISALTIRRMLSHESGLLGDPPDTDWSVARYESDPLANLARVAEIGLRVPPNTQQKYSNLGYQLLGEIVARVSGTSYVEAVQRRLLDPLGLTSTAYELSADLAGRRAVGYAPRAFSDDLRPSIEAVGTYAEGGLWSCVDDLARWIGFQLSPAGDERDGVLSATTRAEMHRARYLGDEAWTQAWCIGWYAVRRDGVTWVQHSGGLHGFITNVCFDPEHGVGAIALVNGLGPAPDIAMRLGAIAREAVRSHPRPAQPPAPLPEQFAQLLGLYTDGEWMAVLRLEWRDGALTWLDPDDPTWHPTLRAADAPDAFVIEPGFRESGEPCVFQRRSDGMVTGVRLGPQTLRRMAPVEPDG